MGRLEPGHRRSHRPPSLSGRVVTGRVLVLPHGRGSCSASGVLLEAIRNETAPAAVIVSRVDPIIGLGAILGDELYGRSLPVVLVEEAARQRIDDGVLVTILRDGRVFIAAGAASPPAQ